MKKPTENQQLAQPSTEGSQPDVRRRGFLIGAGLGTVGAAAAVVGSAALTPSVAAVNAAAVGEEAEGYRETEHVRRYYRTTRL